MLEEYNKLGTGGKGIKDPEKLKLLEEFKEGDLTGGLESASAPRGSEADSLGSDLTKLNPAADSTWVEPRRIHQLRHGLQRTPHGSNAGQT